MKAAVRNAQNGWKLVAPFPQKIVIPAARREATEEPGPSQLPVDAADVFAALRVGRLGPGSALLAQLRPG